MDDVFYNVFWKFLIKIVLKIRAKIFDFFYYIRNFDNSVANNMLVESVNFITSQNTIVVSIVGLEGNKCVGGGKCGDRLFELTEVDVTTAVLVNNTEMFRGKGVEIVFRL